MIQPVLNLLTVTILLATLSAIIWLGLETINYWLPIIGDPALVTS